MPDQLRAVDDGVPGLGNRSLADDQRLQQMRKAWQAYMGNVPDALQTEPGQPDVNVKANRLAPIVDTGIYYLFGLALKQEVDAKSLLGHDLVDPTKPLTGGGLATQREQQQKALGLGGMPSPATHAAMLAGAQRVREAQDYLNAAWGDEDDMMTLLAKLAMNGGVFGHAFAKIVPPVDGKPPRVVALDPQNVSVRTDPEDCDTALAYTITFESSLPDGTQITKRQVIARRDLFDSLNNASDPGQAQSQPGGDDGTRGAGAASGEDASDLGPDDAWVIATYARSGLRGDWTLLTKEGWPHPWPPIADCQNLPVSNQHWGMPDLTPDLVNLNQTLNFVLSNINSIGHSHGHPWVWGAGLNADEIQIAPGRIIALPSPDSKLDALIANGDIAGLMAYSADLRSSMDEQSKVPGVATGRISELPRGQVSGVTVRMLYMPLLFKSTFKRRLYGKLIRELSTRLLALGGYGDGSDSGGVRVTLHWQDPMPTDDLQEAQTAQTWQAVGVSTQTLLARAGFDAEAEAQKNEQESERKVTLQAQGKAPLAPGSPLHPRQSGQSGQSTGDDAATTANADAPSKSLPSGGDDDNGGSNSNAAA